MAIVGSERLSAVIGSIYAAAYEPCLWGSTVSQLRGLFNGSRACLARFGPDPQPHDAINPDLDFAQQLRLIEEFGDDFGMLAGAMSGAPLGTVYGDHQLVGGDALRRSRLWQEWMAPQDMYGGLGCKLLVSGPSFWFFDVQRGKNQADFDAQEVELLQFIAPHLARAADLARKFKTPTASLSAFSQLSFGVVFVDRNLRLVSMNESAEALIARPGSPLRVKSGLLGTNSTRADAALAHLIADACGVNAPGRGGEMMIRSADQTGEGLDIAVSVGPLVEAAIARIPYQPNAVVFMHEISLAVPPGFEDHIRNLFDLTPAEAKLAAALAGAMNMKDAAKLQGIRISTARSYLESIFRKTGSRQQSQLVALLKSSQPLVRRW